MNLALVATMVQHIHIITASILERIGEVGHAVVGAFVVNTASQRDDC
jgi:hypothetical protein